MKKTIMLYLQATLTREGTKNSLKEDEHTVESHNKKSNQNKGFKWKPGRRKMYTTKREYKGKGHTDMSKIKCYNCGEYGHYACDCPKPCDNANIAQEKEENKEFANMMDLDNTSVSEECVMVCMDIHYEDWDEDIIMYSDQGVCNEEHNEPTYAELMKTDSKEE